MNYIYLFIYLFVCFLGNHSQHTRISVGFVFLEFCMVYKLKITRMLQMVPSLVYLTIIHRSWFSIHLIEKTLSVEKHKPLTMRPKGFLGKCISSFAYSKYKPVLL